VIEKRYKVRYCIFQQLNEQSSLISTRIIDHVDSIESTLEFQQMPVKFPALTLCTVNEESVNRPASKAPVSVVNYFFKFIVFLFQLSDILTSFHSGILSCDAT
jgi:hypothetical protein